MSAPIPLRQDFDASELRGLARRSKDGPQARRLLALAAIYDGATRTEAAKIGGVGLQIIRDWVLRSYMISVGQKYLVLKIPKAKGFDRTPRPLFGAATVAQSDWPRH